MGGGSKRGAEERWQTISRALRTFAESTTDYERLLEVIARTVGGRDGCVLRLLSEDGWLANVATHLPIAGHITDESVLARARAHVAARHHIDEHAGLRRVVAGEQVLVPVVDLEELRATATPAMVAIYETLGIHSHLLVPLRMRGASIGTLAVLRFDRELPSFDEGDRDVTQALADHAALALENARFYAAERTARAAAEAAAEQLSASERRYRLMFDMSPLPKWVYDAETFRFIDVNQAALETLGYSRGELLEMRVPDLLPLAEPPAPADIQQGAAGVSKLVVRRLRRKSGDIIQMEVSSHAVVVGGRTARIAIGRDVTERLRLEEQLRQSQKMDAVGRLAGGVAHDFNNILSVILSYGELLLKDLREADPMRDEVLEIHRAAERASDLTRQLLTFSRQRPLTPKVLDLNDVLLGMAKMLDRLLGADVDLVLLPTRPLGRVRADPGSLEQVVMNLAVNARDAMPKGGKLTIETRDVILDASYADAHLGVRPGPHVMLAVSDAGTGIDSATMSRIFEPFFTTKEKGKGTGLGLSTVFGIVQQSGGNIWVYSEPGRGTTFKVYLPRVDAPVDAKETKRAPATPQGTETILLVEDDEQLRLVAAGILRRSGYRVLEARNAGEALVESERYPAAVDLLVSDVVMPHMSGPELAKLLVATRPDMKVLCMSGYTDDSIVRHGVLDANVAYLQKPITPALLAMRVREVLDGLVS